MLFVALSRNNFKFEYVIGRGGVSKVWRVELLKDKETYALKEMFKARIMLKKSVASVMNELKLLPTV